MKRRSRGCRQESLTAARWRPDAELSFHSAAAAAAAAEG